MFHNHQEPSTANKGLPVNWTSTNFEYQEVYYTVEISKLYVFQAVQNDSAQVF